MHVYISLRTSYVLVTIAYTLECPEPENLRVEGTFSHHPIQPPALGWVNFEDESGCLFS